MARPVRRAVAERDGCQCTFVSADGKRCSLRDALIYHCDIARPAPAILERLEPWNLQSGPREQLGPPACFGFANPVCAEHGPLKTTVGVLFSQLENGATASYLDVI